MYSYSAIRSYLPYHSLKHVFVPLLLEILLLLVQSVVETWILQELVVFLLCLSACQSLSLHFFFNDAIVIRRIHKLFGSRDWTHLGVELR